LCRFGRFPSAVIELRLFSALVHTGERHSNGVNDYDYTR
jgi:hypothetical protein